MNPEYINVLKLIAATLERIAKLQALGVAVLADTHDMKYQTGVGGESGYASDIAEQIGEIFEVHIDETLNPSEPELMVNPPDQEPDDEGPSKDAFGIPSDPDDGTPV